MGWLSGKTARLVNGSAELAGALSAHGATIVEGGDCDVLIHAAPPPPARLAHELSFAEWRGALDAGLDQRFHFAREFAASRRESGKPGAILFIGAPEQTLGSDQAAAGGALGNLTKTLGVEWARDGIRVNAVQTCAADDTLFNLAAYLVSDYAAYVTGAVMGVGLDDD